MRVVTEDLFLDWGFGWLLLVAIAVIVVGVVWLRRRYRLDKVTVSVPGVSAELTPREVQADEVGRLRAEYEARLSQLEVRLTAVDGNDGMARTANRVEQVDAGIKAQLAAFNALARELKQADPPPGILDALQAQSKGDNSRAEAIFRETLERKAREGQEANKESARAAIHLGALYWFKDSAKAAEAYRRATELDADNLEAWGQLGRIEEVRGDLAAAAGAQQALLAHAQPGSDDRARMAAMNDLGDLKVAEGRLHEAASS